MIPVQTTITLGATTHQERLQRSRRHWFNHRGGRDPSHRRVALAA